MTSDSAGCTTDFTALAFDGHLASPLASVNSLHLSPVRVPYGSKSESTVVALKDAIEKVFSNSVGLLLLLLLSFGSNESTI
jgi:hypothetical protein